MVRFAQTRIAYIAKPKKKDRLEADCTGEHMTNQSAEQPLGVLMLGYTSDGLEQKLSNLYPHQFMFYGKKFASMEGFLQSLKSRNPFVAEQLAQLTGVSAWREGQKHNNWKEFQLLHFAGAIFFRDSYIYQVLITQAYDALFLASDDFCSALHASLPFELDHKGKTNIRDTVLTKHEYLSQLYRLRSRLV